MQPKGTRTAGNRRRKNCPGRWLTALLLGTALSFLALTPGPAWSNPVLDWTRPYLGPWQYARNPGCIAVDTSGNVYVSGYAVFTTLPSTLSSWVTLKYKPDGQQEWLRQFGSATHIAPVGLALDKGDNLWVTGYSGWIDIYTVKYDKNGTILRQELVHDVTYDWNDPKGLVIDKDGNAIITADSSSGGKHNYLTIKYYAAGGQKSVRYQAPGNLNAPGALTVDGDGNIYVTGASRKDTASPPEFATVKYDADLNQVWAARSPGMGDQLFPKAVAVDAHGNVFVTGYANVSTPPYSTYAVTIKYDNLGGQQWYKTYGGPLGSHAAVEDLKLDAQGNVYVTGTALAADYLWDLATIKYNPATGDIVWEDRHREPNGGCGGLSLALDTQGAVYVLGYRQDLTTHLNDLVLLRYRNSGGLPAWVNRYGEPGRTMDILTAHARLTMDRQGGLYVGATAYLPGQPIKLLYYVTLKYRQVGEVIPAVENLLLN